MLGLLLLVVAGLLAGLTVVATVFVVGMRRKSPTVRRLVRGFARTVVNPRMLRTAGRPGAQAAVIHHVGRRTGRSYRTPVVAEPTDDGFVIALPYGTTSNWVKNVLATGSATLVDEGVSYRVHHPEIVPLAVMATCFPEKERRSHERFRIDQCVRLRIDQDGPTDVPAGDQGPATRNGRAV